MMQRGVAGDVSCHVHNPAQKGLEMAAVAKNGVSCAVGWSCMEDRVLQQCAMVGCSCDEERVQDACRGTICGGPLWIAPVALVYSRTPSCSCEAAMLWADSHPDNVR